jgi:hypothetical protein
VVAAHRDAHPLAHDDLAVHHHRLVLPRAHGEGVRGLVKKFGARSTPAYREGHIVRQVVQLPVIFEVPTAVGRDPGVSRAPERTPR